MPKQPKTLTPLRQVRVATGLLQKDFAALLGLPFDTYQSLELARMGMTPDTAFKIYQATGASPDSLDPKQSTYAKANNEPGEPYSRQTWEQWKQDKEVFERFMSTLIGDLLRWTHFLCDIARRKGKCWETHTKIADALVECATDYGLEKEIAKELKWVHFTTKLKYTYGELRQNRALAVAVGFKDHERRNGRIIENDAEWRTTLVEPTRWNPYGNCPLALKAKLSPLDAEPVKPERRK